MNVAEKLQQLIDTGADQYSPVRFRLIHALVERAATKPAAVQDSIMAKAQKLLDDYPAESMQASPKAEPSPSVVALAELNQYLADILAHNTQPASPELDSFSNELKQQEHNLGLALPIASSQSSVVLKASLAHQQRKEQQRIETFIDDALNLTPENPGPLNPEVLVIRLLKHVHQLSPEYLGRYISYFETLQWLEQLKNKA